MDDRIGVQSKEGQVTQWPARYGSGGPFSPSPGHILTTVPLGGGFFYLLPPGLGIAPDHDDLVKIAEEALKPAPEPQVIAAPDVIEAQAEEEVQAEEEAPITRRKRGEQS